MFSLLLNIIWAAAIPPMNAPDEPQHLTAVMEMRKLGRLPEIHYSFSSNPAGEAVAPYVDPSVQEYVERLDMPEGCCLVPYESMQPPLYYATVALVSLPFSGDAQTMMYLGRLVSALFGAATIYFVWAAVRQVAPNSPLLALACAGCVALLPQVSFNSAYVSNDSALNLLAAASFYVWLRGLREPGFDRYMLKAGALLGLGFLAKSSALTLAPALLVVLLFRAGEGHRSKATFLRRGLPLAAGVGLAFLLICGWYIARNLLVYGEWSGAMDALHSYAAMYPRANLADPQMLGSFFTATFMSVIGVFGWTSTFMPSLIYLLTQVLMVVLLGLSCWALSRAFRTDSRLASDKTRALLILLIASVGVAAAYVQFNVTIALQPQGRYLFMLLVPVSLALMSGVYLLSTRPGRPYLGRPALALPLVWLALVNVVGLITVVSQRGY